MRGWGQWRALPLKALCNLKVEQVRRLQQQVLEPGRLHWRQRLQTEGLLFVAVVRVAVLLVVLQALADVFRRDVLALRAEQRLNTPMGQLAEVRHEDHAPGPLCRLPPALVAQPFRRHPPGRVDGATPFPAPCPPFPLGRILVLSSCII